MAFELQSIELQSIELQDCKILPEVQHYHESVQTTCTATSLPLAASASFTLPHREKYAFAPNPLRLKCLNYTEIFKNRSCRLDTRVAWKSLVPYHLSELATQEKEFMEEKAS